MSDYVSLSVALEGWFDKPLCDLPDALRQRVEQALFPLSWDDISANQRKKWAPEWDYQHDPATEGGRKFWWDFYLRMDKTRDEIEAWEAVSTPTATDLEKKEARLTALKLELSAMERQEKNSGRQRKRPHASPQSSSPEYIAFPKAFKFLLDRLNATPEEIAAWVWDGPDNGGLVAYQNDNELNSPPRFNFAYYQGNDYLSPLMGCWFRADDIASFQPRDRFITGQVLMERWKEKPGIKVDAFIRAKIAESRLLDIHPLMGGTQWSGDENLPPKETALFMLAHVEEIETVDFDRDEIQIEMASNSCRPVNAGQIRHRFLVIKDEDANEQWWKSIMREAKRNGLADCRVGDGKTGPGGSLWRPDLVAGWLVDRHARGLEGLSSPTAGAALKKFPGCAEIAEDQFPPEDSTYLP